MNLFNEFKKVAQLYPEHIALVDDHTQLTYQQVLALIDKKTQDIEHALNQQHGLVAIRLEKSVDYVIAELSCNKAGVPFLPLVKEQEQRNILILSIAKPLLIIDNQSNSNNNGNHSHAWAFSTFENAITYPETCAYVIFTSGTTGTPKGILLGDKPVIDVVKQQSQVFEITSQSRFAWLLSVGFDASLSDIYSTLFSGATLYIPSFTMDKIKLMGDYFTRHQITHSDISPSVLPLIQNRFQHFQSLKSIIFGGEVGNSDVILNLAYHCKMINAYGPTETTICSSLSVVDDNWTPDNIGLPLSGVQYRIDSHTDSHNQGELLIGGKHLALGYLDNSGHHERFFEDDTGRWYRTGDIVEFQHHDINGKTSNGNSNRNSWHFKGRIDRQFKYHGQLICPEEIEKGATSWAGANTAACYFDGEKIHLFYTGTLNEKLMMKELPAYMKPHFFHQVSSLPLNGNGKIDPKQLALLPVPGTQ
jgi:non-ribosomal peptide synthetase component F